MAELEGGALVEELSDRLRHCVQEISDACLDRGGSHKATLVIKLDLSMNQRDKVVEIQATVDEKTPKAPRPRAGIYFCNDEGYLTRENPRQLTIEDELQRKRLQNAEQAAGLRE